MNLEFVLNHDNKYEVSFEVSNDFNVHIEKTSPGPVEFYQSTVSGGNYDKVDITNNTNGVVVDLDFTGVVYPKFIKVISSTNVLSAVLTVAE